MSFRLGRVRTLLVLLSAVALGCMSVAIASPADADLIVNRVSGNAFGVRADGTVLVVPITIEPQPNASLNETSRDDSNQSASDVDQLAGLVIPGLEGIGVIDVATVGLTGPGGFSVSFADIADLVGLVNAQAVHVVCRADATGFVGGTDIVNLGIADAGIIPSGTISPPPNTVIAIPGLDVSITLNEYVDNSPTLEQSPERTRTAGHINGIHIASTGPLGTFDVIIGHAHCDSTNPAEAA